MTVFLGFSCSQHDPSVAVVGEDGVVLFAEANERPLKNKRGWHAPPDAFGVVDALLDRYAGDGPVDASLTWSRRALASSPYLSRVARLAISGYQHVQPARCEADLWRAWTLRHALYRAPASADDLLLNLELRLRQRRGFRERPVRRAWDHHLCHAVTACLSSPFDEALCVVMDGMGEGSSTSVYRFRGGRLERLDRPALTNLASLGQLFSQACHAAGFDPEAGEEWKLMGLAAYGSLDEDLYRDLRGALYVGDGRLRVTRGYTPAMERLLPLRVRGHMANANLAHTAQKVFEDILMEFLGRTHQRWGGEHLVLTGGCALNSSAVGKVLRATPFRRLHVPMAPGDDGNSVGAALLGWRAANPGRTPPRFASPYLGSEISGDAVARLARFGIAPRPVPGGEAGLAEAVATDLAARRIVAVARGRAEFGHRALGARSILADPREAAMRDRINASVKFREEFRPLAPSILHEHGPDYFEDYAASPYMERALRWRPGRAPEGVRHRDGTGRLQSVGPWSDPFLKAVIRSFHAATGLPIVLNTSFNVMGRPMVHDVEDAVGVFLTSDIDVLVLGDALFRKKADRPGVPGRVSR